MAAQRQKLALLDHLGGGNLGDDATLDAVMQNIWKRWPKEEIVGLSMNPKDTKTRHQIPVFPLRRKTWNLEHHTVSTTETTVTKDAKALIRDYPHLFRFLKWVYGLLRKPMEFLQEMAFLFRSLWLLRSLDALLIAGGGQLTDWFGTWGFPYAIFAWVMLARVSNVRCVFLNVGAGPLRHALSRFFVSRALYLSEYVSFRDGRSRTLAYETGWRKQAPVFPDCVYGLEIPPLATGISRQSSQRIVGLAPMALYDPRSIYPEKSQELYEDYIRRLSSFGRWLTSNENCLMLFCTDIGIDPPIVEDLRASLVSRKGEGRTGSVATACTKTVTELLAAMSSMDYVVTCRFHGIVFAHMLNIPVLAISHHPKMDALMSDLGLSDYCLNIRTADSSTLAEVFSRMVENRETIKLRMTTTLERYRRELARQFDDLFPEDAFALKSSRPVAVQV